MPDGHLSLGLVVGLDYHDPLFDPHQAFQRFKLHPLVSDLLRGGQMLKYGAKALPEGGWNTIPRPWMDGALIAGDAGGFLNSFRLKGIHLAMKTGMLAAETAFDAVRAGDTSGARLRAYSDRIDASAVRAELYPVRNVHQAFGHGLVPGLAFAGLDGPHRRALAQSPARHRRPRAHGDARGVLRAPAWPAHRVQRRQARPRRDLRQAHQRALLGHASRRGSAGAPAGPDRRLRTRAAARSTGIPCQRFCPANVYEIVREGGTPRLQINASNCVHCKTCDIMDPYQVITWVPPEGGGGPQYDGL